MDRRPQRKRSPETARLEAQFYAALARLTPEQRDAVLGDLLRLTIETCGLGALKQLGFQEQRKPTGLVSRN